MKECRLTFLGIALAMVFAGSVDAIENWADDKLPIKDRVELWLDATLENRLRTAQQLKIVGNGNLLDTWHDASAKKRDLQQPLSSSRPRLVQTSSGWAVRFDGKDDFVFCGSGDTNFRFATVFLHFQPKTNAGNLRGPLAFNAAGQNDYATGLNVDLGPNASKRLDFLNLEGCGFTGIENLLSKLAHFDTPHTLTISADDKEIQIWLDSVYQGKRKRNEASLSMDEIIVGARHFSNSGEPPFAQNFFDGDISEVLIYSRAFNTDEREQVERYIAGKHKVQDAGERQLMPLVTLSNLPPVQMFVPGFSVREMPVTLSNINCVKYRQDGKLVALGYDGNVWLLSDTDGDGVEDKAAPFWNKPSLRSPIGMALTPPNYAKGTGIFVAAKGKVSLIVDTNKDDAADQEIIVADGWQELPHGVDALGCALDKEGNLYFGLGTQNFTDGYLVDKATGKSQYSLQNERSTILKVSPDFKKREIVCTGIRFPVALEFNSAGDLFCSDQEGATWLPNGNPFDELLHIQPSRHYGFPPRHPKHLPNVIDEPSVFDYGPQHQSTCGFTFNQNKAGKNFGPSWWRDDAFVTGYSRGKIWRTKLVKMSPGYVAQTQLIASLNTLPADNCVSPQGDLVVCVHSGQPDWGSGPTGQGKLYKISFTDKESPQPVQMWAASPTETHIEFDRPLDTAQLRDFTKRVVVTQGRYVSAGDQFEYWRPGYQVVQNQMFEPRYILKIFSAAVDADGRTLIIRTAPRTLAVNYAVTLPKNKAASPLPKEQPQLETIELAHDLTGVAADWQGNDGNVWSGWLPHCDLTVARAFTEASAVHEKLWSQRSKGKLVLRTQLDLWQMLRSATQPGSTLDYEYPPETITVVLKSNSRLEVNSDKFKIERVGENEIHVTATPKANGWLPLHMTLETSKDAGPSLDVSWFTAEDSRPRSLPLRRILLPWATADESVGEKKERVVPELAGGHWLRGKKLFFSEQTGCHKCHVVAGAGTKVGPDLSNLIHRDYLSVMKDIMQPSAAINPDHVAYNVELKNGESVTGVLVGATEGESKFADATGKITVIAKDEIESMKPSSISLMPEGLLNGLSAQQSKDLLTFLMMPPPLEPAPIEAAGEPPPRKRAEFSALLKNESGSSEKAKALRIVLCAGPKDHGPGEHDYPLWQKRWSKLLAMAEEVSVETADKWPSPEQFKTADVIVFYSNNPEWSAGRAPELDAFLNRGGGLVYIHYAVDGHAHCDELAQRIGLAWRGGQSAFRHGALDLKFEPHPITKDFQTAHFVDESYWNLVGNEANIQLVASGIEGGKPRPLMWSREQGKGRVFVSIPGHYNWSFDDPLFRILIFRGIAWSAHQPENRLNDLVEMGARIAE